MDNDVLVRELVEFIFDKKFQVSPGMIVPESFFPRCFLTDDFPHKLRCVFLTRLAVVSDVWQKSEPRFESFCSDMLPCAKYYLESVLAACLLEHFALNKVFDSLINVCCVVRVFCYKIKQKAGMDFGDLSITIALQFYHSVLKSSFLRCGGFIGFLEFIHQHNYLKWNLDENDLDRLDDLSFNVIVSEKLENEKLKEYNYRHSAARRKFSVSKMNSYIESIMKRILTTTSVDFLPIISHEVIQKENELNLNEKANTTEGSLRMATAVKLEHLEKLPSINFYSEGNLEAKAKQIVPLFKKIFQVVNECNRSKNTDFTHREDQLLRKANGILSNLKDTIKSLIEVLDEYDQE